VKLDPAAAVGGVAVAGDGRRVAADGWVVVWDLATGKELARAARPGPPGPVALSPDGRLLAVVAREASEVRLSAADGGAERAVLRHAGAVTGLAFAPDGRTLAVASQDVPVTLWDVTGKK
jgi:WD40 repeat protein